MNFYILAGGKSCRMGENKALLELDGKTIIERVIASIPEGNEAKIVTNSFSEYKKFGLEMLEDRFKDIGPLAGIHAGLNNASQKYSFFLACDLPFLSKELLQTVLLQHKDQNIFGIKSKSGWEPLCAIYSKDCIFVIENQIAKKDFSLQSLISHMDYGFVKISSDESLFNLNTKEDWISIKK